MGDVSFSGDDLIKLQADRIERLAGIKSGYTKTAHVRRTRAFFELKIKEVQDLFAEFFHSHKVIVCTKSDSVVEYFTNSLALKFEEEYTIVYCDIIDAFQAKFPSESQSNEGHTSTAVQRNPSAIQLPNIPIPKFSGQPVDWPSYHDSFNRMVHQNLD